MEKKKVHRRPATAAVSAAAVAVPFVAEAQQQPPGQTVNQGLVPNSWLVDASGNLVWLSEEDLKQYELAQLVTAEGVVQVDEAGAEVLGISTALLNQIGWYSVGAGAAAGAAAALGSGMFGNGAGSTTTSTSSDDVTPSSSSNSSGSVTIVDGLREYGDLEFEFIFEDYNGIERAHFVERLENLFGAGLSVTGSVGYGTIPPPQPPAGPLNSVTTSVDGADLIPGTTSSYSKISAEVTLYADGGGVNDYLYDLFYTDDDGFVELVGLPVSSTIGVSASLIATDDDIVANSTNQSVTYILSDPDGIDRSYLVEVLQWATTGGTDLTALFSSPATISTAVYSWDLIAGTTDVYSSIEFTLSGDTGSLAWYSDPIELFVFDYFVSFEEFNLPLDVVI